MEALGLPALRDWISLQMVVLPGVHEEEGRLQEVLVPDGVALNRRVSRVAGLRSTG